MPERRSARLPSHLCSSGSVTYLGDVVLGDGESGIVWEGGEERSSVQDFSVCGYAGGVCAAVGEGDGGW